MGPSNAVQNLIETRMARLKEASEKRDVDELMSWQSKDITFTDPCMARSPHLILTHPNDS